MNFRKDTIEMLREIEFNERRKNEKDFYKELNLKFKCINEGMTITAKGKLILDLMELIFYVNYKGNSIVVTKCDIARRLITSKSIYRGKAQMILTHLYNIRNSYAHNSYNLYTRLKEFELYLNEISFSELEQAMKLIMKHTYPHEIHNIYHLVKQEDNKAYTELLSKIKSKIENFKLPSKDRTVSKVIEDLSEEYNEDILNCAMLDYLKTSYYINQA